MTESSKDAPTPAERFSKPPLRSAGTITLIALGLGLAVELLFDGHRLGVNFPLWAALSAAGLLWAARLEGARPSRPERFLAVPILFFAAMASLRSEPLSVFLSVVGTLLLFGLWVRAFRPGGVARYGWLDFIAAGIWTPVAALARPWPTLSRALRRAFGEERARGRAAAALRGVLLALPVVAVFAALLAAADLVFSAALEDLLRWLNLEKLLEYVGRTLVVALSGLFSLGAMAAALGEADEPSLIGEEEPVLRPFVGFVESAVVLGAVDLLFASFVAVQFRYLFGGTANIHRAGFTYADYARRGFGELVAVAVLSLVLLLALGYWGVREGRSQRGWFRGLSAALVALVGVILISALQRLLLYENAYGFTRQRTYTHVFILWLGVSLAAFLVALFAGRMRRFAPAAVVCAIGFAATLNLMNVDAVIVRRNVERVAAGHDLDVGYLSQLSVDAVPALTRAAQGLGGEPRIELMGLLACRAYFAEQEGRDDSWPSLHFGRLRAARALEGIADELRAYQVSYEDYGYVVNGPGGEGTCWAWGWD